MADGSVAFGLYQGSVLKTKQNKTEKQLCKDRTNVPHFFIHFRGMSSVMERWPSRLHRKKHSTTFQKHLPKNLSIFLIIFKDKILLH